MKKLIIFAFVFLMGNANAQEKPDWELITTISSGLYLFNDWQINQNLVQAGFPEIPTYELPLGVSEFFRYKKLVVFPGISSNEMFENKSGNKLSSSIFTFNMPVLYQAIHSKVFDFYVGASYQYSTHIAELSKGQSQIDLDNISNTLSSEFTSLRLAQSGVGPSLYIRESKIRDNPLMLQISYLFPFREKTWENTYGEVINSPLEKSNTFCVTLVLGILKL